MKKRMIIKNANNIFAKFWNFCWEIYYKNPEIWNYLIAGAFGVVVSIVCFYIPRKFGLGVLESNIISWIIGVVFVYVTNKIFVFNSKCENKKELIKEFLQFIVARLLTLAIETFILYLMIDVVHLGDLISKTFAQIVIIIINYILSKFIIFTKR